MPPIITQRPFLKAQHATILPLMHSANSDIQGIVRKSWSALLIHTKDNLIRRSALNSMVGTSKRKSERVSGGHDDGLSCLITDTNVAVDIKIAGHGHQGNKNMVIIASFHTSCGRIVAWHLNGYTIWRMLKKDNLTRCCITNLSGTIGRLVWAEENGVQMSLSTI